MENTRATLFLSLLVLCHGMAMATSFFGDEDWSRRREEKPASSHSHSHSRDSFLLKRSSRIVKTAAGEMRVLKSNCDKILERHMHIGFISMQPNSLYVPQYLDSSMTVFVHLGEAKMGYVYKNKLSETTLKRGDVYRIPAGSAFYLLNTANDQRLHVICSIDPSESLGVDVFQSFYLGGASVLSGFHHDILESAFNVSKSELEKIFTKKHEGPFVFVGDSNSPSRWTKFPELKEQERLGNLKRMAEDREEVVDVEEEQTSRSWRKLLKRAFGKNKLKAGEKDTNKSSDCCNLYDRKPDFINSYGSSVHLDGSNYSPLNNSGMAVHLVNLTAGSMMTPHMNPMATEYGVVLKGSGSIQIVFPDGSNAMNTAVKAGDVFFVPRYFPFCQVAAMGEDLEIFGFTTSTGMNKPEFLVGAKSLLQTMMGTELAAAFGVSETTLKEVLNAQHDSIIVPAGMAAPMSD